MTKFVLPLVLCVLIGVYKEIKRGHLAVKFCTSPMQETVQYTEYKITF